MSVAPSESPKGPWLASKDGFLCIRIRGDFDATNSFASLTMALGDPARGLAQSSKFILDGDGLMPHRTRWGEPIGSGEATCMAPQLSGHGGP